MNFDEAFQIPMLTILHVKFVFIIVTCNSKEL